MEFETIEQGFNCDHHEKKDYVIDNQNDWIELSGNLFNWSNPSHELPDVDFNNFTLIAVFFGLKNTGGYTIEIEKIRVDKTNIIVDVKRSRPLWSRNNTSVY